MFTRVPHLDLEAKVLIAMEVRVSDATATAETREIGSSSVEGKMTTATEAGGNPLEIMIDLTELRAPTILTIESRGHLATRDRSRGPAVIRNKRLGGRLRICIRIEERTGTGMTMMLGGVGVVELGRIF